MKSREIKTTWRLVTPLFGGGAQPVWLWLPLCLWPVRWGPSRLRALLLLLWLVVWLGLRTM